MAGLRWFQTSPTSRRSLPRCPTGMPGPPTRFWATTTSGFRAETSMVVDSSALIAILLSEVDAPRLTKAIASDAVRLVGAPTVVEAAAVMLARKGPGGE